MSWSSRIITWSYYLLFISVPLIFLASTSELFEFNKMILTYLLTVIIAVAWLVRMLLAKRIIFRRSLLDIPILIFLVSQFLSLIFSVDPRVSWLGYYGRFNGGLVSLVCYSLLYWAFVSNMTKKSAQTTIYCSLATAAIISIWGILEHFGSSFSCLLTTGHFNDACWVQLVKDRVFATLGQPNWLAAYLTALIFIPISLGLQNAKRRPIYYLLSAICFLALLFTNSRSGMFAFGVAALVFWSIHLWTTKNWKTFIILNSLFIIPLLIFPNVTRDLIFKNGSLPVRSQPASVAKEGPALETGGTESGAIRKIVWTGAIRAWLSSPKTILIGFGPETFTMAYYQFRPIEHNNTSEWELLYNKAHNEFLNYLTTTGLVGLLSYLLLLGTMFWTFIRPLKKFEIPALLAGWLTIPITNFWGFSVVIMQILLFLLPALALVLSAPEMPPLKPHHSSAAGYFAAGLIFLFAGYLGIVILRYWTADTYFAAAQKYEHIFTASQDPQDLFSAFQFAGQSVDLNPGEPSLNSEYSTLAAFMSLVTSETNATASAQLARLAQSHGQQAIITSPHHPNYYKSLSRALIVLSTQNPAYLPEADKVLAAAQTISPTDPRLPFNRGIIAKYLKNYSAAVKFFSAALALKPDFADAQGQLAIVATSAGVLK